jgi:hypothetical protein
MQRNRYELQQETIVIALPRAIFHRSERWLSAWRRFPALAICWVLLAAGATSAAGEVQIGRDITKLPPAVQRMRQAILQAAASGDIAQLRLPIDMNEIPPVFGKGNARDPIAYFKATSADGNGREILALLYSLLTTGYAIANPGTKDEMIVWPYHALMAPNALTPSQEVELYRFLPPARFKEMLARGKYSFYSIGIARDGVWHYFTSE